MYAGKNHIPQKLLYKKYWSWCFLVLILGAITFFTILLVDYLNKNEKKVGPKPILSLPFPLDLSPNAMSPMGETIAHPDIQPDKIGGHPGIDFYWTIPPTIYEPKIITAMDAEIMAIKDDPNLPEEITIITAQDGWGVDYQVDKKKINISLKVGDKIKRGDYLGAPPYYEKESLDQYMIHWQFGYYDPSFGVSDRLCPISYFDDLSKMKIEKIWAETENDVLKANAPDICSYIFKGKDQ